MRSLLEKLVDEHGEPAGTALYNLQVEANAKARAKHQEQQRQLAELSAAIALKREIAARRLQPLEGAADAAYQNFLRCCERVEQQKQTDAAAISGLVEQQHTLIREMNRPRFENRSRWTKLPDGAMPQPAGA
jgi:Tfp pilus assembly protein FimV